MSTSEELDSEDEKKSPKRILIQTQKKTNVNSSSDNQEILIVASKLKKYIKDKHGLSTSAEVMQMLSDIVRVTCDRAVESARRDGRKTLMNRDF